MARNHPICVCYGVFSSFFQATEFSRPCDRSRVPKKFPGGCNDHLHQWLGDFPDIVMVHAANANRTHWQSHIPGFFWHNFGLEISVAGAWGTIPMVSASVPMLSHHKYWACNTNQWNCPLCSKSFARMTARVYDSVHSQFQMLIHKRQWSS